MFYSLTFFSGVPRDCSWILTNHSLRKYIMTKYSGTKNINNTTVGKMKGNTHIVYFVFQMQIMLGMHADLQAPCKKFQCLQMADMLGFVISCFLSFSFYVSKSYQGNDKCFSFFLSLSISFAEPCKVVCIYQGHETAGHK